MAGIEQTLSRPLTAGMDNVDAWRLGEICNKAASDPKVGDYIDRGLILLRVLEEQGYRIVKVEGVWPEAR